ncbi:hypothetical protein TeGR_g2058, partial [Tetraparma gracilis]
MTALQEQLKKSTESNNKLAKDLKTARAKISAMQGASESQEDLGAKLLDTSTQLVEEAQKSVKVTAALETSKQKVADLKSEKAQFRELLFGGINGGVSDTSNYEHVSLADLLRLRLQEADNAVAEARRQADQRRKEAETMAPSMSETLPRQVEGGGEGGEAAADGEEGATGGATEGAIAGVQKLEQALKAMTSKNKALQGKYDGLENKLEQALSKIEDLKNVAGKNSLLADRSRTEKELRARAEQGLRLSNKKVEALSDHIEK